MKIAVGFFDGVHIGHREILKGVDGAVSFNNHPLSVLAPEKAPRLLMREKDRVDAIKACGVAAVVTMDFTRDVAKWKPERFVRFASKGMPVVFRCGADWRFGRDGKGDAEFVRAMGYGAEVVPAIEAAGGIVSSSRIREAVEDGRIAEANTMLGRPFSFACRPTRGKGLGTKIGFPTVNLKPLAPAFEGASLVRPPRGVYCVEAGGKRGVANWGFAPTMGERAWKKPVLEIHFLDAPPGPADETRVDFLGFIRPERKFESVDALKTQIAADVAAAR